MRSGKRNLLWHLFRLERALACRWNDARRATGPWPVWSDPYDGLRCRALHIEREECDANVLCTAGEFLRAMEAIGRVP